MDEKLKALQKNPRPELTSDHDATPGGEAKRKATERDGFLKKAGKIGLAAEVEVFLANADTRPYDNSGILDTLRNPQARRTYADAEAMDKLVVDESNEPLSLEEAQASYNGNGVTPHPDGTYTLRADGLTHHVDSQGALLEQPSQ